MKAKELLDTQEKRWLFLQFLLINDTARHVYEAVQGGIELNFYSCFKQYENGVIGWVKESRSFETSISIYELYTSNDGWDVLNQIEEEFGEYLINANYDHLAEIRKQIES